MSRISNVLNDNYKKKSEILDTLKDFLINSSISTGNFVPYPHFLLLEDRSLTYYVESRKSINPLLCGDVYSLTDKAMKEIEEALSEFRHQYGYNISYGVDNYGEIQFYAE
jgi:hypothetical protein